MPDQPTGLVTFLFTDIEGSTRLWETHPQGMKKAFTRQETLLRDTVVEYGGYPYKMVGDAFQVAFQEPIQAARAAVEIQRRLVRENWGEVVIRIRMALHSCQTEERGDDYVGPELNRLARLMNSGYGEQILMTHVTAEFLRVLGDQDFRLVDLGQHYLKDLLQPEHVFQVLAKGLREQFPPLKTLGSLSRSIRTQSTLFIGRREEFEEIRTLLTGETTGARLVSLVGQGGVGKTRLAYQISASLIPFFPQGVFFVDLTSSLTQDDILLKISQSMNFQFFRNQENGYPEQSNLEQLVNYLQWKKILLVLDNYEQLVQYSGLISELLAGANDLKILITTRERLNLPEEWVVALEGLPVPGLGDPLVIQKSEAVELFVRCAERSGLRHISIEDWQEIGQICRLVDGLPLGIELAAAWVRMFSLVEIRQKMEKSLDFLQESQRGHPDRHRSMRAVFENSWNLLSQEERIALRRLSIFLDDFLVDAALEVARTNLTTLSSLLDKCLLKRLTHGRLLIHPILMQFISEKMQEDLSDKHATEAIFAQYYAEKLCKSGENLFGSEYLAARDYLNQEKQHLQLAWKILVVHEQFDMIRPLIPIVTLSYDMFGSRKEGAVGMRLLVQQLKLYLSKNNIEEIDDIYALALASLRILTDFTQPESDQMQHESLQIADRLPVSREKAYIYILCCTGNGLLDLQKIISLSNECIEFFTSMNDQWGKALSMLVLGDALNFVSGSSQKAMTHYLSSLDIFNHLNNRWGQALCYHGMALINEKLGNYQEAYELNAKSLEIYKHLQNMDRSIPVRHFQALLAQQLGLIHQAQDLYQENLDYFIKVGNLPAQELYSNLLNQLQP